MSNFDNFSVPKIIITPLSQQFLFLFFFLDPSIKVHRNWTLKNEERDSVMFTLPQEFFLSLNTSVLKIVKLVSYQNIT